MSAPLRIMGGAINENVRLFEFDSVFLWEQWENYLAEAEEGKQRVNRLSKYIVSLERELLHSVY